MNRLGGGNPEQIAANMFAVAAKHLAEALGSAAIGAGDLPSALRPVTRLSG